MRRTRSMVQPSRDSEIARNRMDRESHSDFGAAVPPDDEISLVEIANVILRNWRVVVALPLALAIAFSLWPLFQDRTYAASASFIPQTSERRGGGASALAQQFGISLGSELPGQSPQFYVDLLQSLPVLREAVESVYVVPSGEQNGEGATLIEIFDVEEEGPVPPWRKAVDELDSRISTSVALETGLVRLTVSTSHPDLSEQIAQRLLAILNEFNLEVRQNRAEEEGRFIAGRLAEAEAELLAAERGLQEFLRQNRQFENSPDLIFEHDRLQRQVSMRQEVYTSLLRSQEDARIDAVRDTPLLTILDHPAGAAEPEGRNIILRGILAFMFGLMIAVAAAFFIEFSRHSKKTNDPRYREFESLIQGVWEDLRQPSRWVRRRDKPAK